MKRLLTPMRVATFLTLIWLLIFWAGPKFDEVCVEGRLSAEQVKAINSLPWGKCPSYQEGECRVEEGDRVLAQECSELSRLVFLQDWR